MANGRTPSEHTVFDQVADKYDQLPVEFFGPVGERLVALAGIQPGDRVLDIGCGRGAVTFPAARAAGTTGSVLGVDLSPRMVEATRTRAAALGLHRTRTMVMDGQKPTLPAGTFDAVVGGMSVHMVADLRTAYRAYRDLLRPEGRLALSAPATDLSPRPRVFGLETIANLSAAYATDNGVYPNGEAFGGQDRLQDDLRVCGFTDVRLTVERAFIRAGTARDVVRWTWTHGMKRLWERVPQHRHAHLESRIAAEITAGHLDGGRVVLPVPVLYATAARPAA
ncbi:class I SAM-dependent methyltransferase [Streptomyces anulatus]|uniref:class I SAM-dependent methyltransferase n=1 Tax=Streptomyces anulatus TaxID=1892 RepID=UPI0036DA8BB5